MELQAYLDRIGYAGPVQPDLETLRAIHRAHVESIPYENLDVQFGVKVSRAVPAIFDKIVRRRRGGWCYEMNGLLSWALEEIGFSVKRLAGGVRREVVGDQAVGNHLVLLVDLGETWLADAGFGNGLIEPIRLREGAFRVGPLNCSLERIDGGWYRYFDDAITGGPSFDFHEDVSDEALLEARCRFLQSDPSSNFVLNAVVQRWRSGEHTSLRGRTLTRINSGGKETRLIGGADAYVATLRDAFDMDLPEAAQLWPKICARHEILFASVPDGHSGA